MESFPRFEVPRQVEAGAPIGFVLTATNAEGTVIEHPFPCLSAPPASVWRGVRGATMMHADVIEFIEGCLASEEELQIFRGWISSRELTIRAEFLGQIASSLMEQYADRPTSPSVESTNGLHVIGTSSTGGASSEGSIS